METTFCQSCGMPLNSDGELHGTNTDGSKNAEYCTYCYQEGKFTEDMSMEDMIEFCVPHMVESNPGISEDEARASMKVFFPKLKRWAAQ